MSGEKCALNCPKCGVVEGYIPDANEGYDEAAPPLEEVIEEAVVHTTSGVTTRIRCPRCGSWIGANQARPV